MKVVALVKVTARSSEAFLFSKDACRLGVANVFATTLRFPFGATSFSQRHPAVGVGLDAEPTNVSLCGQAAHVIHSAPTFVLQVLAKLRESRTFTIAAKVIP